MKTTNEKLNQIYKGCDKIVDELMCAVRNEYDQARFELAETILSIIEEN